MQESAPFFLWAKKIIKMRRTDSSCVRLELKVFHFLSAKVPKT